MQGADTARFCAMYGTCMYSVLCNGLQCVGVTSSIQGS